ncbi:PorT family protein [Hymenobacter sp. BT683]|uniref:PorT family protein n=1 Tax=Hymenobacter jeongseonensis TaxID=2791027 RepID=A0ABS0IDN4_9BACT|nr:porin family protein [Hymenobacter jeongseonensis]MBF9236462.1 PorT family protein [Hymenobacter jeongseonensis]
MKKVLLSLGLLMSVATAASAQEIRFGVKAGANYSSITANNTDGVESKIGLHAGALANFALSDLISIQPEVLYSQKGYQSEEYNDIKYKINYIDVPLLVKVNAGGLFFEGGPQVGFLAGAKVTNGDADTDIKGRYDRVDFGYVAGLGYQATSGPMIGLRYNGGISTISKGDINPNKIRNSVFQLYVGYVFGGK